eukprot:c31555_g1_i1 orf=12-170(-)
MEILIINFHYHERGHLKKKRGSYDYHIKWPLLSTMTLFSPNFEATLSSMHVS